MTELTTAPGVAPTNAAEAALAAYNTEQVAVAAARARRIPLFIGSTLVATVAVAAVAIQFDLDRDFLSTPMLVTYFVGFMAIFFAWDAAEKPAKRLQQGLRDRILPHAFSFLENPAYAHAAQPQSAQYIPRQAIGTFNRSAYGDVISGAYDGVPLEIFEATFRHKAGKSDSIAFKGMILAVRLEKPFPGTLIAISKTGNVTRWFRDLFGNAMETHDFVDPAIGEAFEVRSTNGEATRKLLDGALAKALKFLRDTWPDGQPRLALNEGNAFVLLPSYKDFFELPKIGTPVHYAGHIEPMANELKSLAAIGALASRLG